MIDEYISAITKIANHDKVKKHLEPNLMWHENIKEWQVKRTLYAWRLLENELCKITREPVSEIAIPDEGTIRGDT